MNMMMRLTAVAACLVGASLAAQDSVGTLLGNVTNEKGAVLQGVRLQITSPAMLGTRTVVSDAKGEFRFALLPPGDYSLSAALSGYTGGTIKVSVRSGNLLRQEVRLREVKTATAEVEVVATAAAVDKTDTKTGTTISAEALRALPVSVYAPTAMFLTPGVSGSSDYPAIRGGVGGASAFTINGVSVRDGILRYGRQTAYNIADLTEDIQVITSPLNAKFGNTSGGIVNLVTKSGSNDFRGSLRASLGRGWGVRNSPITYRRFNSTTPTNPVPNAYLGGSNTTLDDLSRSYQLTLLGPIIKDKLTFSYGRNWAPVSMTTATLANVLGAGYGNVINALTGTTAGATSAGYTWGATDPAQSRVITGVGSKDVVQQGKLFWQVNENHQVEFFYTRDDYGPAMDTQYAVIDDVSDRQQSSVRTFMGINYRAIISSGFLDLRIGQTKKEIKWPSGPGEPINVRSWVPNAASILSSYSGRSGSYLTNGDPGYPDPELRQNDNIYLNYSWSGQNHNFDVGVEQLKETYLGYEAAGAKRRRFYVPGRNAAGNYAVYNWYTSPLSNPAIMSLTSAAYNSIANTPGNAFVPEMRTWADSGTSDPRNIDNTRSIWFNDQWTISDQWIVMAGLRLENWTVENRLGKELDSKGLSPRLEVKYDLNGDNKHLLALSYAHFRGTMGSGNLGAYRRSPGNLQRRYFWNTGAGSLYYVPQSEVLNAANYQQFQWFDTDAGREINPDIRPEMTKQVELQYNRSFESGGSFRTSLVHRKIVDLWYRRGINEVVAVGDTTTIRNMLDFDPYQNRSYKAIELEWTIPLYRGSEHNVELRGFWVSARSKGRVTWSDEGASTAIRFDDIYHANGYSIDKYNSYGEYGNVSHNNLKTWLTWAMGRKGISSTISLLGEYSSGRPYSATFSEYLPGQGAGDTRPTILQPTKDTPTSVAYFLVPRGSFTGPDSFYVDLRWNVTVPIRGRVSFFTEFNISNLFNTLLPSGYSRDADGAIRSGITTDRTYSVNPTNDSFSKYGMVSGFSFGRSYSLDCGIRF